MTPSRLYDIFKENFPEKAKHMISYKRVDENSIQLKAMNRYSYIFRYIDKDSVSLERIYTSKKGTKNMV